jgi:ribosomal protein S12 methylthiotransferase accessory factor
VPSPAAVPAPAQLGQEVEPGFMAAAAAAAARCGVTRVGDITGLDRIGLPVWQAVRPAGRSLSVHQGKGASDAAARLGAMCEAVESHCAEHAPADGPFCDFAALAAAERAPEPSDYCWRRDQVRAARGPVQWTLAEDLLSGGTSYLPHPLVSLNYARDLPSPFDRSSSGLGAGPEIGAATRTALLEAVERDAFGAWRRSPLGERLQSKVRVKTVGLPWFAEWQQRLAGLGVRITVFLCPSVNGVPVVACALRGPGEFGGVQRSYYGTAAHGDPEIALFKSLAEAAQSRLTFIAAARDDITPSHYAHSPALEPERDLAAALDWRSVEPAPDSVEALAERLAAAGYPRIAVKRLGQDLPGIAVVKLFVPGLGSPTRERRVP